MSRREVVRYGQSMDAKDEKAARLAAALRANLRRRKAQARGDVPAAPEAPWAED